MPLCTMDAMSEHHEGRARPRYRNPADVRSISLAKLLTEISRPPLQGKQFELLRGPNALLHYAGDLGLLRSPCVSVVGTRDVSDPGRVRTHRLARELVDAGVVIVSGLARGVDTEAMT